MGTFNVSNSVSFVFEEKKKTHEWVFSHKDYHPHARKHIANRSEEKLKADPYHPTNTPALEYGENMLYYLLSKWFKAMNISSIICLIGLKMLHIFFLLFLRVFKLTGVYTSQPHRPLPA